MLAKTLERLLGRKDIKPVNPKGNQSWIFIGRTDAEAPILWPPDVKNWLMWKDPVCWERLKAGGEGDSKGWDSWMAAPTWWKWVWASSRSWWWTGKPGMLQSMGSQRVRHDWVTELTDWYKTINFFSLHTLVWVWFLRFATERSLANWINLIKQNSSAAHYHHIGIYMWFPGFLLSLAKKNNRK